MKYFTLSKVVDNPMYVYLLATGGQQFRIEPQSRWIHKGSELLLECAVTNQAGSVQWVKDGVILSK
jgi:hypothetical protein